jgi:hypothetical protein
MSSEDDLKRPLGKKLPFFWNDPKKCLEEIGLTVYEQERGIYVVSKEFIYDNPEFKIGKIKKSDDTSTLVIIFKKAKNKDIWQSWIPTKNQFEILEKMPQIIKELEFENEDKRKQEK